MLYKIGFNILNKFNILHFRFNINILYTCEFCGLGKNLIWTMNKKHIQMEMKE